MAIYQSLSQNYIDTRKTSNLKSLMSIKKQLPKYLARRVEFLSAYHNTRFIRGTKYASQLVKAANRLPKSHQIVANLTLSQKYAGLNSVGQKIAKTNRKYKVYLTRALSKARSLSKTEKKKFFRSLWESGEKV